jgi:hypothetical protein
MKNIAWAQGLKIINPGDCSGPPFSSGRNDQALPTVLKNLVQGPPIAYGVTQIDGMVKIQGQGGLIGFPITPPEGCGLQ